MILSGFAQHEVKCTLRYRPVIPPTPDIALCAVRPAPLCLADISIYQRYCWACSARLSNVVFCRHLVNEAVLHQPDLLLAAILDHAYAKEPFQLSQKSHAVCSLQLSIKLAVDVLVPRRYSYNYIIHKEEDDQAIVAEQAGHSRDLLKAQLLKRSSQVLVP
jgi:hypothetical protein